MTWWTTPPLTRSSLLIPVPSVQAKSVDLYAGRNEFEPFQIVLRARSEGISGVDIEFSDFRTAEGASIARKYVTVYLEAFVNLKRPSSIEGGDGLWPDPLIPRMDRYAHEARNAFPFAVQRGRNQPLWVEIFVPAQTRPGDYAGSARISLGGRCSFRCPSTHGLEVRPSLHFHA